MAKKLLSAFVALTMLTPAFALADETPDPDYVVLPIEAGDIVPFDGILLSLDAAAKVLNEKRFSDVLTAVLVPENKDADQLRKIILELIQMKYTTLCILFIDLISNIK